MIGSRTGSKNGRRADTHAQGRYLPPGYDAIAKPRAPRSGGGEGRTPSQRRIFLSLALFAACFTLVGARLVGLAIMGGDGESNVAIASAATQIHRPDIVDRNGEVMATDIATASLFADARYVIDPAETARQLASVLPDLDVQDVTQKLETGRAFIWLKRDLTPKQQYAVHYLGMPGLDFRNEQKRVYPNGKTGSNVLGMVDIDNRGIAGIERYMTRDGPNSTAIARSCFPSICMCNMRCAMNSKNRWRNSAPWPRSASSWTCIRAKWSR